MRIIMEFIKTKTSKIVINILFIMGLTSFLYLLHKSIEGDSFDITFYDLMTLANTVFIASLMAFNRWK